MSNLTQTQIAAYLDLSVTALRELLPKIGLDHRTASLDEIRVGYIRHLREIAAGRSGEEDGVSLALERALLARSQRAGQDIKNAVAMGLYAPIALLGNVLADASQAVVDRFDQLPARLKQTCPDLPAAGRQAVMDTLNDARNEWARKTSTLLADKLGDADQPIGEDPEALLTDDDADPA